MNSLGPAAEIETNNQFGEKVMSIVQIARGNIDEGCRVLTAGEPDYADVHSHGLGSMLGLIVACVGYGMDTKPEIVQQMRSAVPGLSKKFARQLVDLLTGSDPQQHLLQKRFNGTYVTIGAEDRMVQPSQAGVQ